MIDSPYIRDITQDIKDGRYDCLNKIQISRTIGNKVFGRRIYIYSNEKIFDGMLRYKIDKEVQKIIVYAYLYTGLDNKEIILDLLYYEFKESYNLTRYLTLIRADLLLVPQPKYTNNIKWHFIPSELLKISEDKIKLNIPVMAFISS
jgi:hypothetical protein